MVGGVEVGDVEVDVLDAVVATVPNCTGRVISPSGLDALPGTTPQKEESEGAKLY